MTLTTKQKKAAKIVGFVVLALVVFVFALARTFPYDRVKDRMIEALSAKYDVEIGDVKPGILPGTMIIDSVKLQTRPTTPDEKPAVIFLETVKVDIGLLALIGGTRKVNITASVPGGTVVVRIEESAAGQRIVIRTDGLALGSLPWVKEAVGLPMAGPLHVDANIWLPKKKWKDAEGEISFSCTGCTVGDGKSKLSLPNPAAKRRRSQNAEIFASAGITVPKLKLGVAEGKMTIKKGVGTIESFGAKSKDGWLKLDDAELKFSDPVERSTLPGCLRFQLSDELKAREKEFGNIDLMLSERSRQDDGSYAIPLKGNLKALRPNPRQRCKGAAGDDANEKLSRPTIELPTVDRTPAEPVEKIEPDEPAITDEGGDDEPATMPVRGSAGPALSTDLLRNGKLQSGREDGDNGKGDNGDGSNGDTAGSDDDGDGRDDGDDGTGDQGNADEPEGGSEPEGDGQDPGEDRVQ